MSPAPSFAQHYVARVPFSSASPREAADYLAGTRGSVPEHTHVHLANAYTLAIADRDAEYRGLLTEGAVNFPDGKPIGLVSRLRGDRHPLQQVRGPQFMLDVIEASEHTGAKHFFLGSTDAVLTQLVANIQERYPRANIVGAESPPFRALSAEEWSAQVERVRVSGADIVWVGLGTPKQDKVAADLAKELPVSCVAIGAAFDYAAGTLRPAPEWVSKVGMEWAHRLMAEPKRLWKRYLFGNTRFIIAAARWGAVADA